MQSLKIKQEEASQVATNNLRGHQLSAIDCDKPFNLIVGQLPERGNTYNDLSQLPNSLQEVWKTPQRTPTLSLQYLPANIHRRTYKAARRHAFALRQSVARSTTVSRRLFCSHNGTHHRHWQNRDSLFACFGWRAVRAADGKETPQRQG